MFDLAEDATSIQLIREFYEADLIIATVCHGSIALANVKLSDGSYLIAGEKVTGFSNAEVESYDTNFEPIIVPSLHLEDALQQSSGGNYEKAAEPWTPNVIVSTTKKLLSGENPASAKPLAEALLKKIKETT